MSMYRPDSSDLISASVCASCAAANPGTITGNSSARAMFLIGFIECLPKLTVRPS